MGFSLRTYLEKFLTIKAFLVFSLIILALKIVFSFKTDFSGNHFEDWRIAQNLVTFGKYSEFIDIGPTAYKLPIYPLFLSVFMYLFPSNFQEVIVVAQHLIFFFVPFLIIAILRIFSREKAGVIAGYLFIFSPAYFYYSNVYEVTNVFIPIFLTWCFIYLKIFTKQYTTTKHFAFLGMATALLFLTQVVVVPLVLVFFIALVIMKKSPVKLLALSCLIAMLCYSPWIIRNSVTFDKLILTKTPVWQNVFLSYTSQVNIWKELNLISDKNESIMFDKRLVTDEFTMEKLYQNEVEKALEGNRYVATKKGIQNAIILWTVPSRYFYDNSLSILIGRKFFLLIIHFLSLISLIYFYNMGNKLLVFSFLLVFVSFTMPYMIGHAANMRFKLDFEYFQYILIALFLSEYFLKSKGHMLNTAI